MIFVTGPMFSGKEAWLKKELGWGDKEFAERAVRDAQDLVRRDRMMDGAELVSLADELARKEAVIASEVGGGVVPDTPEARFFRENAGRLACLLAERADTVVRVCCGLPQVLKEQKS